LGLDKVLEMESSKNNKVEKRSYDDVANEDEDAQNHLTQSKKPKLPGLARYFNRT
jgi:hypothetical protein